MDSELTEFLHRHHPQVVDRTDWGDGAMPLRVAAHLTPDMPPPAYVTSVRCIVLHGDEVLVYTDHIGREHILPGGRRERDERLVETLRREVLEETGVIVRDPVVLGFLHFHHLAPKPVSYAYPYPDFLQVVYVGQTEGEQPDARIADPYVTGSGFRPLAEVQTLGLDPIERPFLLAAISSRRES